MKAVSYVGQEKSPLGSNTGPRDVGAPPLPSEARNGNEVPRLVQLMAISDRIQPDSVSRSSELRRLRSSPQSGFHFMDGEQMTPVAQPEPKVAISKPVAQSTPAEKTNGEAPRKYVWRERHRVTFRFGFMTVTVPAVSIIVDGPVVMIYTPLEHDTKVEPPRGERIEMSVRSIEDEHLPFAEGKTVVLQSTGIYMDVRVFRSRCGIFFRVEE